MSKSATQCAPKRRLRASKRGFGQHRLLRPRLWALTSRREVAPSFEKAGLCPYAIAPFAALPFARPLPQSRRRPHGTYSEVPKNYLCQPRAGTDSTPVALPAQDFFPPTLCIPYGYRLAVP